MFKFKKKDNIKLSANFSSGEFVCHCIYSDCDEQLLSKTLVDKIQKVRDNYGKSLRITSACRCAKKQADLRNDSNFKTAKNASTHQIDYVDISGKVGTIGLDVQPSHLTHSNDQEFRKEEMEKLLKCLEKEFKSIGIAKNFFHIDERSDYRRWNY